MAFNQSGCSINTNQKGVIITMTLLEKLTEITGSLEIAEKVNSSLGEFMIPKGTFNALNAKLKLAETETSEVRSLLAERDSELEKIQTANMSEVEKMQHQLEKMQSKIYEQEFENNKLAATSKLAKAGFGEVEIEKIVNAHVTDDADKTNAAIDLFVSVVSSKTEEARESTKKEIYKEDTKFDDKGDHPSNIADLDVETFKKMDALSRNKLFVENREEYNKLNEIVKNEL